MVIGVIDIFEGIYVRNVKSGAVRAVMGPQVTREGFLIIIIF